jgi:signal transduction histidine kinase
MAPRVGFLPATRELPATLAVSLGLAGYVVLVYVLVVLGGGLLIGQTDAPNLALSVVATAVVALGFGPIQTRLERVASRLAGHVSQSPYEVLRHFSDQVTAGYDSEAIPVQMAKLLAEGTGARWAQVWLVIAGRPALAASWPPAEITDLQPPDVTGTFSELPGSPLRSLPVRHGGSVLAVLRVRENDRQPLTPVAEKLFAGLAAQAGLVLRAAALRVELSQRLAELSARAGELQSSRERLVDTQDDERRRLERDIHDGAQQHLVALAVNLRLAQALVARSSDRVDQVLAAQVEAVREAIATLTRLSRGIYPSLLAEQGLVPALQAAAAISPLRVTVYSEPFPRLELDTLAALYFCCLEALQNVAKHSGAQQASVRLTCRDGQIVLLVEDNGAGFDQAAVLAASGLANMRDRIDAVGGWLQVRSAPRDGTRIEFRVPAVAAARLQ